MHILSTSKIMCVIIRERAVVACLFYIMFDLLEAALKATELKVLQDGNVLN